MSLELQVKTSPVPAGFCFGGFNSSSWLDIVELLHVEFPGNVSFWNIGSETPSPADRDKPWFRYNIDGTPDLIYVYAMGAWLSKHADAPGKVILYEGTEASIDTFDGGEAGAITDISGPFWQRVTEMDAKFPIGPGTTPIAPAGTGTTINVGDTGGEELHALTGDENGPHTHPFVAIQGGGPAALPAGADVGNKVGNTQSSGLGSPHNTMPPWRAIFFLRRTNRLFRRI